MKRLRNTARTGFTIIEIMLAIFIFSLVLTAIYSIWLSIMKGSRLGMEAAASVQRGRIAMRALEDAFVTSVMYSANLTNYLFFADTSGNMATVSMVSRLPGSFPGVGRYDQVVRRVTFEVVPSPTGNRLIMHQAPLLQDTERVPAYSLTLARNVTLFQMEFYDLEMGEWVQEWESTNQVPRMVRVALGLGQSSNNQNVPQDLVTRLIAMPSMAVAGDIQGAGPPTGVPNLPPGVGGRRTAPTRPPSNLPNGRANPRPGFPGGVNRNNPRRPF